MSMTNVNATSILESLGGVVSDAPPNTIYVTLDLGEGYSLKLSNTWYKNYIEWKVFDERDTDEYPIPLIRGGITRLDEARDDPRFAITKERDSVSIGKVSGVSDYSAIGRAFERLQVELGNWLVHNTSDYITIEG